MKRALVCGAGGFVSGHLVKRLKREGYWVRGVDLKPHEFAPTQADEFLLLDLRDPENCRDALTLPDGTFDEVYQLAADMGGMGFISRAECEVLHNNALINIHMSHKAAEMSVARYFFSSSVCVYRDMQPGEPALTEDDAIPANPDNEYGWEKLYAERLAMAYGRRYGMKVRIARFENCYGPEGTWRGGREKAPAAICRKVAEAGDGATIEVWGDGTAIRVFTYADDLVEGIYTMIHSDPSTSSGQCLEGPVNLGSDERVTVADLVKTVIEVSGKKITVRYVPGPVGVQSRNFSKARIKSLGWEARVSLRDGIARTYPWIEAQVRTKALAAQFHRA
ncbi:NAD-dependent epimerase/dehydratase family protein [Candidatus Methylomirabilis sp.]|uniref:NAD-dependent epimerase/dehydratase family protein n=1 Tax=Candidatus Methylomirabilis sp. TaxID=2032687 RepID=UPI003C72CF55